MVGKTSYKDLFDRMTMLRPTTGTGGLTAGNSVALAPTASYWEDFEGYNDTTGAAAWGYTDGGGASSARVMNATANAVGYGDQSLRITTTTGNASDGDIMYDTITSLDVTGLTLHYIAQCSDNAAGTFALWLSDGTNTASCNIAFTAASTFQKQSDVLTVANFPKIGGSNVDITAITKMGFIVVDDDGGPTLDVSAMWIGPATPVACEAYKMDMDGASGSSPKVQHIGQALYTVSAAAEATVRAKPFSRYSGTSLIPGLYVYPSATAGSVQQLITKPGEGLYTPPIGIAISTTEWVTL